MTRSTVLTSSTGDLPFNAAPAVLAGDWLFLGGTLGVGWEPANSLDACARDFPFHQYPMRQQTREIFSKLSDLCRAGGTDLNNMVRIDQFATDWDEFRHYFPVRNEYLTKDRPASTAIAVQSLLIPRAALIVDGIAVVPHDGLVKEALNSPLAPAPKAGYSMATRFGDWVWTAGASPTDFASRAPYLGGLGHTQPDGVWVDPNFAYDLDIINQARYDLYKIGLYLDAADSDLEHVIKAQVYLTDARDLPGLIDVWREAWGNSLPATSIVPIDRMLIGGSKCEINVVAITKSGKLERETVHASNVPALPFGLPHAVKAGPFVFLSGIMAIDETGIDQRAHRGSSASPFLLSQGRDEVHVILEHADAICAAAGGSRDDIVRVQLFTTEIRETGAALGPWNAAFTGDPPTLSVIGVTGPHVVPNLAFAADVVAYVP